MKIIRRRNKALEILLNATHRLSHPNEIHQSLTVKHIKHE